MKPLPYPIKILASTLILALLISGCSSTTLFETIPKDAKIYINGQISGTTPYYYSDTKIAFASTPIVFKKDGYHDLAILLKRNEKADVGAIIGGFFLGGVPWLWFMEYNDSHYYEMEKVESDKQVISDLDSERYRANDPKKEIMISKTVPEVDTSRYEDINLDKREDIEETVSKADTSFYLTGDDGRIILTVDSITKAELFPEELKENDIISGKKKEYRPPKAGHDYVFVHVTIIEKRDSKIEPTEFRLTKTQLIDDKGKTYLAGLGYFNITFTDKKTGYILFEIPKGVTPVQMRYLYQYRDKSPDSQEINIGKLDIDFLKHGETLNETRSISEESTGTVKDIDGNVYKTVTIGTQTWMAENLKVTKYNDGTDIPFISAAGKWKRLTTPAYCWSGKDAALYNWYAVSTNKLCPTGWHISSDAEWTILETYLINNGYGYEGNGDDIAKSMAATSGWSGYSMVNVSGMRVSTRQGTPGNDQASNNSSGFTARPDGTRNWAGSYYFSGYSGYWWSPSEESPTKVAKFRSLINEDDDLFSMVLDKRSGLSIRCIKDQ